MSFGNRMRNEEVVERWMEGGSARNHNGTLLCKMTGELVYVGKLIGFKKNGDLISPYEYILMNPDYATSRTMRKHVYSIIRSLRTHKILLLPDADLHELRKDTRLGMESDG